MKVLRLVGIVFAGVAAALLVVAATLFLRDRAFAARASRATGEVVALVPLRSSDRGEMYASRIRFRTADGRPIEFVESLSSKPPRHDVGERVPILYDPARPEAASVDDLLGRGFASLVVGGIGTVFALVAAILLGIHLRQRRAKERLLRDGRPIQATFLHVFTDHGLKINGRYPYRIAAQATDPATGALRRFDSEPIWVDPTARLAGRTVPVLIGRHMGDYLVDLRGLVEPDAIA